MDKSAPVARLISPAFLPTRRRMLRGALALLGLGAAARIVPTSLLNKMPHTDGGDFVIINGWVLPARYFRG
jgi:hypothetical protein